MPIKQPEGVKNYLATLPKALTVKDINALKAKAIADLAKYKAKEKAYTLRVKAGIKVLDKQFGRAKWLKRIKLSMLDLGDSTTCICGQLFGDYTDMLFGSQDYHDLSDDWKEKHGFVEIYRSGVNDDYDLLTYVWFKELSKLKKA